MPYQYCHQCNFGWVFLAISIASCVVAIIHANRGNPDKAIWPIGFFKLIGYRHITDLIERETRHDLKKFGWQERLLGIFWYSRAIEIATRDVPIKYSWREGFLAAWFAWFIIGIAAYIGGTKILTMVGAITVI